MKRKGFRKADLHEKIKSDPEFAIHFVEAQSTDYGELLREYNSLKAENERLRADLFWYVLDAFVQGTHRQEDGGYHTGGISTYRDLGNWLVEHAHWTRRPGGRGRNQVYDPPKEDAASEGQP